MRHLVLAALASFFAGAAVAQTPGKLEIPVALFVTERATGFGMYEARPTNHFKSGEPLLFYVEPTGFQYRKDGGLTKFGSVMDLRLRQGDKLLYSKDGFLQAAFVSHHENKELNFSGTLNVDGAPAGDYVLELVLQDSMSNGIAKVALPFIIE